MRRFIFIIALAGCGRVGFDPRASSDATSPEDGNVDLDGLFAGCTRDTFDEIAAVWDIYGDQPVVATGTLRVDLDGAVTASNGLQRVDRRSYVGWTTIVEVVQPCAQDNTFTGLGWHDDGSGDPPIHMSIMQGEIRVDLGDGGGVRSEYDPVDDRWLRLREENGRVFAATSPDGGTWDEFGSISFDAGFMHTDIGVDSPFLTVNPDFAIFDNYIECPP